MADLPADLIDRARSILEHLEAEPAPDEAKRETRPTSETDVAQLSLFEKSDSLTDELLALDLLAMNPIEAMQALYALQQAAKKG